MLSLFTASMAFSAPVTSWYDSGTRLSPSGMAGAVVPTAPITQPPEQLLQRYLQLRHILSGEPLEDAYVLSLIRQIAAATPPSFDEGTIWGDWQLVYQKDAKDSTKSQKALNGLPAYANFMMAEYGQSGLYNGYTTKIFRNLVYVSKERFQVIADVAYTPPAADSPTPNRIGSVICKAGVQMKLGRRFGWKPLWLPLPLKGTGWLDVVYLDEEMRITKGNRGGVFVHIRPNLLTREAAEAA